MLNIDRLSDGPGYRNEMLAALAAAGLGEAGLEGFPGGRGAGGDLDDGVGGAEGAIDGLHGGAEDGLNGAGEDEAVVAGEFDGFGGVAIHDAGEGIGIAAAALDEEGGGAGVTLFESVLGEAGVVAVDLVAGEGSGVAGVAEENGAERAAGGADGEDGNIVIDGAGKLAAAGAGAAAVDGEAGQALFKRASSAPPSASNPTTPAPSWAWAAWCPFPGA